MGKKKQKEEEKKEKPIFGSGAEILPEPKDDRLVKCVCTVPCAWRGYHDEGDRVFVERKLLESDPFFKGHFKAVDGVVADAEQNGEAAEGEVTDGGDGQGEQNGEAAEGEATDGGDGQGELDLK